MAPSCFIGASVARSLVFLGASPRDAIGQVAAESNVIVADVGDLRY